MNFEEYKDSDIFLRERRIKRTTELKDLHNKSHFTWGEPIDVYDIGPYAFLKYHPWVIDDHSILTGVVDIDKIAYHIWIDGKDSSVVCATLDEALVTAVAIKNEGFGSCAATYFMKMIRPIS